MIKEPILVDSGPLLDHQGLVHRVAVPAGSPPYPTVVMLHGRGGNEDVMWLFARTVPAGALLIAPRAIIADPDGGYSWMRRAANEWLTLEQFEPAVQSVTRFMAALPAGYGADPQRIYLMAFSQGTAVAYALALLRPGLVKGIAGLVGFVPAGYAAAATSNSLAKLPIFMAVGKTDERIPYPVAVQCGRTLSLAGADLTYREYDTGHKLNPAGVRELTAWWQQQLIK